MRAWNAGKKIVSHVELSDGLLLVAIVFFFFANSWSWPSFFMWKTIWIHLQNIRWMCHVESYLNHAKPEILLSVFYTMPHRLLCYDFIHVCRFLRKLSCFFVVVVVVVLWVDVDIISFCDLSPEKNLRGNGWQRAADQWNITNVRRFTTTTGRYAGHHRQGNQWNQENGTKG